LPSIFYSLGVPHNSEIGYSAKLLFQKDLQADLIYWTGSVLLGLVSLQLGITLADWMLRKLDRDWAS